MPSQECYKAGARAEPKGGRLRGCCGCGRWRWQLRTLARGQRLAWRCHPGGGPPWRRGARRNTRLLPHAALPQPPSHAGGRAGQGAALHVLSLLRVPFTFTNLSSAGRQAGRRAGQGAALHRGREAAQRAADGRGVRGGGGRAAGGCTWQRWSSRVPGDVPACAPLVPRAPRQRAPAARCAGSVLQRARALQPACSAALRMHALWPPCREDRRPTCTARTSSMHLPAYQAGSDALPLLAPWSAARQVSDLYDPREQWASYVLNAIKAKELFVRDVSYIVRANEVRRQGLLGGRAARGRWRAAGAAVRQVARAQHPTTSLSCTASNHPPHPPTAPATPARPRSSSWTSSRGARCRGGAGPTACTRPSRPRRGWRSRTSPSRSPPSPTRWGGCRLDARASVRHVMRIAAAAARGASRGGRAGRLAAAPPQPGCLGLRPADRGWAWCARLHPSTHPAPPAHPARPPTLPARPPRPAHPHPPRPPQNFFRAYPKLAGMTGTAATESAEFSQARAGPADRGP